ncbi:MAG TPA: outer membrane protein transport protein [Kofleriaceae bacterium]|nr:outer membrane protein transport protein [Kofleriaceae bacterium]
MNRLATLIAIAGGLGAWSEARAGGMLLPVRGVRTVERAGALIAGADDADALWLDPAGLAHLAGDGKIQLLVDAAFVSQAVDYARIDSGGNHLASVSNQSPGMPIPTIAASLGIGDRLVLAGGIAAPYAGVHRYGDGGAQRYASVSLEGSAFVYVTAGAAYKLTDQLRIGATVMDVVSRLSSRIVLSGCPGQTVCAPEDPDFDALAQVSQTDLVAPSGSVGVQYDAAPIATLGLAFQAPSRVSATGKFMSRLPSSAFFNGARVVGDESDLSFTLPAVIRAGVELHPMPELRVEAALDAELWSMHDAIDITPHGIRIENAPGVGTYTVGKIAIPQKFKNSFAPSIGGEWHGPNYVVGAGYSYETAAAPADYVSVLAVDSAKHLIGIGGGYEAGGWQIGGSLGVVLLSEVQVALADGKVTQLTPLRDQPSSVVINAGSYKSHYLIAGLRFARQF